MIRRYEKWPSYNKFCCFGLCIQGPDRWRQYLSFIMIAVPCCIFWIYTCPFLIRHQLESGIVITAVSVFLGFLSILFLFITGNMDPGIMPRQPRVQEDNPFNALPRTRFVTLASGKVEECKWCDTCSFYRPPRVVHCGTCSNCVEDFDHHCPWLGNCIGKRNYRFYLYFIWTVFIFALFILGSCIWHVVLMCVEAGGSFGNILLSAFLYSSTSWVLAVYVAIVLFMDGMLVFYHLRLLLRNQTTYELIRNKYPIPSTSPYYVGPLRYILEKCCGAYRWNFLDRREWISAAHELNSLEREAYPPFKVWPPPAPPSSVSRSSSSASTVDRGTPSTPSRSTRTFGEGEEDTILTTSPEHEHEHDNPVFLATDPLVPEFET